jgi:hypothetical protein
LPEGGITVEDGFEEAEEKTFSGHLATARSLLFDNDL